MKESGTFDVKSKLAFLKNFPKKKEPAFQAEPAVQTQEQTGKRPVRTVKQVMDVIRVLCLAVYRLRALFLAIPVVFAALRLAAYNSEHLPLLVGLDLQSTGEFAKVISRQSAVTFPLMITAICLGLMCFSRKTLYPWLISIFSLAIPVLLLLTNSLPA